MDQQGDESAVTDEALPQVKRQDSMQTKLLLWSVLLVAVPTFICALCLAQMAASAMSRQHTVSVAITAQTLAASLADRLHDGLTIKPDEDMLAAIRLDPRLAFVAVEDTRGNRLQYEAADLDAWNTYDQWLAAVGPAGQAYAATPIILGEFGELVVHKAPIWNPPLDPRAPRQIESENRKLEGFVLLALRQRALGETIVELRTTQVIVACLICLLAMPFIAWYARRWASPLRVLLRATTRLAAGQTPATVDVHNNDELGVLATAFNRMAQKLIAAQVELRQANEALEHKVVERTADLERVNRRLESEIRDKNEFLRAVSHDLNAPLRNISGMANMLIKKHDGELADDVIGKLQRITANVKVQTDLIGDLMDLSQIRSRPGRKQQIDLGELLGQIRDSLAFDLENNRITLQIDPEMPTIVADRNRMQQVFQNLLDNAIKYMGESDVRRITVGFDSSDGEFHFTVADTGSGIDSKDLPHVFNVFRRGTYSGTHDVAGRGVGLAGVKSIVECHGGRVWAESEYGVGSTFHVALDARQVEVAEPAVR